MAGYGLGGMLLSLVASIMAHDADYRLASVSLFGSQDFAAGGLELFPAEEKLNTPHGISPIAVVGSGTTCPPNWEQDIAPQDASWWPQWAAWLARHSGPPIEPPPMDSALGDAPDATVLEA